MKKLSVGFLSVALCFAVVCGFAACGEGAETPGGTVSPAAAAARVMSLNVAGQDMTLPENVNAVRYPGQTGWDYTYEKRRRRLDALVGEFRPDVLFLQEVNGKNWWWPYLVTDADSFLNTFPEYALVGRTNRIGESDGESKNWFDLYNQLYYNREKFDAVATGMFYLNSKRTAPFSEEWHESAYYDSDDNNTCVWAVLKDKSTGVSAVYASTHLKPTGGYLARALTNYRQAMHLADGLYEIAGRHADAGGVLPVIVGGDFNLQITHAYNYAYPHLTENAHYSDAQKIAARSDKSGTARVWGKNPNATTDDGSTSDGYRIDLFLTQGVTVDCYQCLNGTFLEDANGVYYTAERIFDGGAYDLSDHLPVMIDVKIPQNGRTVAAPSGCFRNDAADADKSLPAGGNSAVSPQKICFTAADVLAYFEDGGYFAADVVSDGAFGGVLRLTATESCPNARAAFDYGALMRAKGLCPAEIGAFGKIRITYKTALTVKGSELAVAVLSEGDGAVRYGVNTVPIANAPAYATATFEIAKSGAASGAVTSIVFGTMAYVSDFSGTCGMFAGDSLYIAAIELIA